MKLPCDDDGVSEILGYVLILSMTTTALALVLLLVFPSIQDTKDNGQLREIQQGFTVTDSRLSKARFSTSIFQEAPFNLNKGTVSVDDDYQNSHIIVTQDPGNKPLYPNPANPDPVYGTNIPLGTVRFEKDNVEVGYQGGGVWVLYNKGMPTESCEMVSPPDFDYNTVTLTLPIMRIARNDDPTNFQGADTVSGIDNTVYIDSSSSGTINLKFPDPNGAVGYTNPLLEENNVIIVTIKSDYYMGWASYFKERGLEPVPDPTQKTVVVSLSTGNGRQETHIKNNGGDDNDFNTKHLKTTDPAKTPIEIFQFKMVPFDPSQGEGAIGNAFRVNYDSYSATTPDPRLQIYVGRTTTHLNHDYAEVTFTFTYTIPVGNPDAGNYKEVFRGYLPYQRKSQDEYFVDLLSLNNVPKWDADDLVYYDVMEYLPDASSPHPSVSWGDDWDKYNAGSEIDPTIVDPNDPRSKFKSAFDVTQHYMWIMSNKFPYDEGDPNSGPVYQNTDAKHLDKTGASSLILQYSSDEQIKYLYITEGTLTTGISSRGS